MYLKRIWTVLLGACLLISFCCRPSRVLLSPFPDRIETVQGFASLKVSGTKSFSRSKFSFLFVLPDKGRIEAFDFLGRTLYQIIIVDDKAYLVAPSKKVYWKSGEEEIIEKFLGFRLSLAEIFAVLTGQWSGLGVQTENKELSLWEIKKDREGRIVQGKKQGMTFQVNEYIEGTDLIRTLSFKSQFQSGKLNILSIDFSDTGKEGLFSLSFTREFEEKSWDEIKTIMSHENKGVF